MTLNEVGQPQEHIAFATGHCVYYHEVFEAGNQRQGSYRCQVHITDPTGFTLGPGASDAPYAAPAAREHGQPVAASAATVPPPPPGTVSTCPPDVTARLQTQVELACNSKGVKSTCTKFDSCPALLEKITISRACIQARRNIMNQCFGGGDEKHEVQVENRERGLAHCIAAYESQCGPLPTPSPVPVAVPRREPGTSPEEHKLDPAVPTTLAGAALLILYIITSAFRPGPI